MVFLVKVGVWVWLAVSSLAVGACVGYAIRRLRRGKQTAALTLAAKQVANTTAGRAATREVERKLAAWSGALTKKQQEHLEMFSAAYWKHCDLPPDEVQLVQEILGAEKVVWYFEPKTPRKRRA